MRLGIDIGGTFTDILALRSDGQTVRLKVPSTPTDYGIAICNGLHNLIHSGDIRTADVVDLIHGTTVAANAILSGTYAKTGLITTRGFRDVLEIGRLRMPRLFDLAWEKPPMLVPRHLRTEVEERIRSDGSVATPLDESSVEDAITRFHEEGVSAVAVCLINSYTNPSHEHQIGSILRKRDDWVVSLSHDVLPEIKEYERTSTCVVNACLIPVIREYLQTLEKTVSKLAIAGPLWVMQSGGGITNVATATEFPVRIIESGPAAGVVAAATIGATSGYRDVIAFDMGGTTAKASLVEDGVVPRATDFEVGGGISLAGRLMGGGGYPVRTPCVDLAEVGAGGGSVLRVDEGGVLQVGPHSAGADPGPVCYRQGGSDATLTDANLILGYLNPAGLAGGTLPLDRDSAVAAMERQVSGPLGLSVEEAALGAFRIGVARMVRAVRAVSSERGRDPRLYTLIASGGSGPLHAAAMATDLGIQTVLVPPAPGLFSAYGLLAAPLEHDAALSLMMPLSQLTVEQLTGKFAQLDEQAVAQLPKAELNRSVDLRYIGQSHELNIPLPTPPWADETLFVLGESFEALHEQTYGHRSQGEPIEIAAMRVRSSVTLQPPLLGIESSIADPTTRNAYFGADKGWIDTYSVPRSHLSKVASHGPLIVEDYDATTLVPPGMTCLLDEHGNIILKKEDTI